MEQILPVIDHAVLQEKANEYAMKGALKVIEEFYTGYNSPYKKAIEEDLVKKGVSYSFDLPDILAVLNDKLSAEVDAVANSAVAQSFIPLVAKFLTRREKEIKLSDILKSFIEGASTYNGPDRDDYDLSLDFNEQYKWYEMSITDGKRLYRLTLHCNYDDKNKPEKERRYNILGLPDGGSSHNHTMELCCDGCTLKLPFTRDVLRDEFQSYIAGLLIAKSNITIDMDYFDYSLFPDDDHCHCH